MIIDKESCYFLGKIVRTSGLKGDVSVFLDVDEPESYAELDSVFVERKGALVPYFIESVQIRPNGAVFHFEDTDFEAAQALVGSALYLPLELLPPLIGKQFYFHEVRGFEVVDAEAGDIGKLREIWDNAAQPLMCIDHPSGKEIMIPLVDDFLVDVDRENRVLKVKAPEGLVEFYLEGGQQ